MHRGRNTDRAVPNPKGDWDVRGDGAAPDRIEVDSPTHPQPKA